VGLSAKMLTSVQERVPLRFFSPPERSMLGTSPFRMVLGHLVGDWHTGASQCVLITASIKHTKGNGLTLTSVRILSGRSLQRLNALEQCQHAVLKIRYIHCVTPEKQMYHAPTKGVTVHTQMYSSLRVG